MIFFTVSDFFTKQPLGFLQVFRSEKLPFEALAEIIKFIK